MSQNKSRKMVPYLFFAVLAFGVGAYLNYNPKAIPATVDTSQLEMTVLKQPRNIKDFVLTEYQHQPFTKKSLQGQWTMMFFGFTNCPHMCPTTLAELNKSFATLNQQKVKQLPQVVLVTVDPERDTPKRVYEYAQGFNPNFIGVRAEKNQLDELTKALGIAYFKTKAKAKDTNDNKSYSINHSGAIILFNPQGKVAGFFSYPHNAKTLAHDFIAISQQA